jgi:hypothetical protein
MLIQLTYASRVAKPLGPADVRDILTASRRNNAEAGITGALCLSNGIFLQRLEGDRRDVNAVYHRILRDARHTEPAILDFEAIDARMFATWNMGLIAAVEDNLALFLKYSSRPRFDPYAMSPASLRALFAEVIGSTRWLS